MSVVEKTRRPLQNRLERAEIIQKIEKLCKKLDIPIEVDLRCYTYPELVLAYIRLQLAEPEKK